MLNIKIYYLLLRIKDYLSKDKIKETKNGFYLSKSESSFVSKKIFNRNLLVLKNTNSEFKN